MLQLRITHGREADREECQGYYSVFLTRTFVEEFYYVSRTYNLGDLEIRPRFSLRKPTSQPFRIAGQDGSERPVVELRFRLPKFLFIVRSGAIEQKVEFVH